MSSVTIHFLLFLFQLRIENEWTHWTKKQLNNISIISYWQMLPADVWERDEGRLIYTCIRVFSLSIKQNVWYFIVATELQNQDSEQQTSNLLLPTGWSERCHPTQTAPPGCRPPPGVRSRPCTCSGRPPGDLRMYATSWPGRFETCTPGKPWGRRRWKTCRCRKGATTPTTNATSRVYKMWVWFWFPSSRVN